MSNRFKSKSKETNNRFDSMRDDSTKETSHFKSKRKEPELKVNSRFSAMCDDSAKESNHFKRDDRRERDRDRRRNRDYDRYRTTHDDSSFAQYVEKRPPKLTEEDFPSLGEEKVENSVVANKDETDENTGISFSQIAKEEASTIKVSESIKPGWVELKMGPNRQIITTYGPPVKNAFDFEAYDASQKALEWIEKREREKEEFIELYGWEEYYKYHYPTDDEEEEEEEYFEDEEEYDDEDDY